MCQHADSRRAHTHLDSQRAENLRARMHLDSQCAETPRAQKYWSVSEYFIASPNKIYEPADLKSEILLQGVLILSRNSLLYFNYACQHHFCIFFLHASECQRADTSRATVHNDSQRSENPRATVHNDSQHADISRATLKVTTSVLTEQN